MTQPTDEKGGFITDSNLRVLSCQPDTNEYTWAKAENGNVLIRVQA